MRNIVCLLLMMFLAACDTAVSPSPPAPTPSSLPPATTAVNPAPPPPTSAPTPIPELNSDQPAAAQEPSPTPTWPPPMPTIAPFSRTEATAAERAAAEALAHASPPERDDVALAMAYAGLVEAPSLTAPPVTGPLPVGTRQRLVISNLDTNTETEIEAILLAVSEHGYFWFDAGPGSLQPGQAALDEATAAFDAIYETSVQLFGSENNPGIDGDPRIHIVHASPLVLCDVTLTTAANCGIAGYYSASNTLPAAVRERSNEREMFIMNAQQFGTGFYLNVLGHEFRHMIEDHYDRGDIDWEVEGSAVLAEELLGLGNSGQQRGNLFLRNPDQQLNSWTDDNTLPFYGQGYLLNRAIYDRLGPDLYRQFATSPEPGLAAVDQIAAANGLAISGESVWLDWLATLTLHNDPNAADVYHFPGLTLDTVAMTAVSSLPFVFDTTVSQYAADYYSLPVSGKITVQFTGEAVTPLLDTLPVSGERMWYAQRANYSNPRLTRTVDLREVPSATLQYAAYVDIEQGYDFAYVSVSTDSGRTWQGLASPHMQGADPADDPAGSALTERFYTGRQRNWVKERVDLTPFAGRQIQIRFEYVTDLILTYGGFALDNIAIPEIGFYDDVETVDDGWQAEGFTPVTAVLPQTWRLQLIRYVDGVPVVEALALDEGQRLTFTVTGNGGKRPILIVAAIAPMTLEPARYRLVIESQGSGG